MTIQSWGYGPTASNPNGTIAPNQVWAQMQWTLGRSYWIYSSDQVTCTPVASGTRQVTIGTGFLGAWGILDQITQAETLTLPTVSTGTRYFLIVARRTWDTTQATSLAIIDAGTTGNVTLPPRNTSPGTGTGDDQPLWMVPLTAGQTVPGAPIPVGAYGTGSERYIRNILARQYLTDLGTVVWLGNVKHRCRINAAGTALEWVQETAVGLGQILTGSDVLTTSTAEGVDSGYSGGGVTIEAYLNGSGTVDLYVEIRRTGAPVDFTDVQGQAANGDFIVARLQPAVRPRRPRIVAFEYISTSAGGSTCGGTLTIGSDGLCTVKVGTASTSLRQSTSATATKWDLRFSDLFDRRTNPAS